MSRCTAFFLALCVWWALLAGGCCSAKTRADVSANTLSWNRNIAWGRQAWLKEARTRFADPFVMVMHGDSSGKDWRAAPDRKFCNADVESVGWLLHGLMPDRDVVLVCCNSEGIKPRLPKRVWYSPKGPVWSDPGPDDRWCGWGIGSVFELVEGTERE